MEKEKNNINPNDAKSNHFNEPEDNNTTYDITGNMNIWRVHETYEGTGNKNIRDEILR